MKRLKKATAFKFVDLFSGVGGFHLALKSAGGNCVAAAEWDKFARETYKMNHYDDAKKMFDSGLFFEDVRKIKGDEVPSHDVLCGGFPCQAFSIAGKKQGFSDERGNLFFDIVRILKAKKPKAIFLENVKNLVSHDGGNTFSVILAKLEKLGYHVKHKVLNSYEYGNVPQNRERIYIVGFLDKKSYDAFEFPEQIPLTNTITKLLERKVLKEFSYEGKPLYEKLKKDIVKKGVAYQWRRKYVRENKKGVIPTLTANMGTGGHNVPLVLTDDGIRKLTPRECFSAQGFPKSFQLPKMANSHLYKQAGNSVSVPVIRRIAENIVSAMSK